MSVEGDEHSRSAMLAVGLVGLGTELGAFQVTGSFIVLDHEAVPGRFNASKGEGARNGSIAEEALSAVHKGREDDQNEVWNQRRLRDWLPAHPEPLSVILVQSHPVHGAERELFGLA
jgi:hypothetical protein